VHRAPHRRELRLLRRSRLDGEGAADRRARLGKDEQERIPDTIYDPAVEASSGLAHQL